MNGYELTAKLRRSRRLYPLTATEQALYHELVAICNDVDWEDIFSCSNEELCSSLNISENTLNAARCTLVQKKLIFYKSGKSKRQFGKYSFSKDITTSKFDTNTATNAATNTGVNPEVDAATKAEDYIKDKPKPKPKKINYRDNVQLTFEENERFVKELGQDFTDKVYDYFRDIKIEKGYKTKDDNLTIRRWVIKAVQEKENGKNNKTPYSSKQAGANALLADIQNELAARGKANNGY